MYLWIELFIGAAGFVVLLVLGEALRNAFAFDRGNYVLALGAAAVFTLTLAARYLGKGDRRLAALAAGISVAIACGTAAWLSHPDTQSAVAFDRVADIEHSILRFKLDLESEDEDIRRQAELAITRLDQELAARKLECRAAVIRSAESARTSITTLVLAALAVASLGAGLWYAVAAGATRDPRHY
ncbi:MAG: hypothetical protein V1694_11870 [Candidatus Eisenbacteria bacterium]